jgi:hypothetical protein
MRADGIRRSRRQRGWSGLVVILVALAIVGFSRRTR